MQRQVRQLAAAFAAALGACVAPPLRPASRPEARWQASAAEYRASARLVGLVQVGRPARLDVALETRGGFHLNDDYPHRFTALPSPTLDYGAPLIEATAMTHTPCGKVAGQACGVEVAVPFVARATGPGVAAGELAFGACDAERCIIEKLAISVPLDVTP